MFGPTTTPLPLMPSAASIWNGWFGMPVDWACVSVTG